MTFFEDLSEYSYCYSRFPANNVGWLGQGHSFSTGALDEVTLDRIWNLCRISVVQTRGIHQCEFCRGRSNFVTRKGENLYLGSAEVRAFGRGDVTYAAPNLIYHYMEAHSYRPPEEFIVAVVEGPAPPSEEYFVRLKKLEPDWRMTSAPAEAPIAFRFVRTPSGVVKIRADDKGSGDV